MITMGQKADIVERVGRDSMKIQNDNTQKTENVYLNRCWIFCRNFANWKLVNSHSPQGTTQQLSFIKHWMTENRTSKGLQQRPFVRHYNANARLQMPLKTFLCTEKKARHLQFFCSNAHTQQFKMSHKHKNRHLCFRLILSKGDINLVRLKEHGISSDPIKNKWFSASFWGTK